MINFADNVFALSQDRTVQVVIGCLLVLAIIGSILKKAIKLAIAVGLTCLVIYTGIIPRVLYTGNSVRLVGKEVLKVNGVEVPLTNVDGIEANNSLKSILIRYTDGSVVTIPISSGIDKVKRLTENLVQAAEYVNK